MRVNCGPSTKEKRQAKEDWHRWFAWRPVLVGEHDCRWLEFVMRKGTFYRIPGYAVLEYKYKEIGCD